MAVREEEMGPEWDFFFQPCYQSTDESDIDDGIDPDTETEEQLDVSSTRKPWISRPPMYRTKEVGYIFTLATRLVDPCHRWKR